MTSRPDNRRPYASVSSVLAVIDRARTMNLPDSIDVGFMNVAGVEGQAVPRTRDTLAFLGLIDETGSGTPAFEDLANVPDSEFPERLRTVVEVAYSEELSIIDPKIDDADKIRGVFQKYTPKSTTGKMVSLFLGLCKASGMELKEAPPTRSLVSSTTKKEAGTRAKRPSGRSGRGSRETSSDGPSVLVHGISEADIRSFKEKADFDSTWQALGSLIWRRLHQEDPEQPELPLSLPSGMERNTQ